MAWVYVPGLAPLKNLSDSLLKEAGEDFKLFVMLSGIPIAKGYWWPGWRKRAWSARLFGTISQPSMANLCAERFISSLQACPAKPTRSRGSKQATPTSEAGAKATDLSPMSCESLPSVNPPWSSLSASQLGFDLLTSGFDLSGKNYADWVTLSLSLSLSLRQTLAQAMNASGSLCWPTPRAKCGGADFAKEDRSATGEALEEKAQKWPTPRANDRETTRTENGNPEKDGRVLSQEAAKWPTPNANPEAPNMSKVRENGRIAERNTEQCLGKMAINWPTPNSRDHKDTPGMATSAINPDGSDRDRLDQLPRVAQTWTLPQDQTIPAGPKSSNDGPTLRRRLNPGFVCWLMGLPWWWTRAEPISFAASEMVACRFRQQRQLRFFLSALGSVT